MAGNGGTDSNLRGFLVTDFADHDDVGVLTQNGTKGGGEGHVSLGVDLGLVDACHGEFHGVFNSDDIYRGVVHFLQEGIKRGGFTTAGRAGQQDDTVRPGKHLVDDNVFLRSKAQVCPGKVEGGFIQHTDNEFFTENSGQGGHTEVIFLFAYNHIDTAVLGNTALRDIHAGHNFQSGANGGIGVNGELGAVLQVTVDTVAHPHNFFKGFDVDIAGAVGDGFLDDGIHQTNRGIVNNIAFAGKTLTAFLQQADLLLCVFSVFRSLKAAVVEITAEMESTYRSICTGGTRTKSKLQLSWAAMAD